MTSLYRFIYREIILNHIAHSELVSCVGWTTPDECYSGADDHLVLKWNLNSNETTTLVKLPDDVFPTDMHWFPRSAGGGKKAGSDIFVLTSTDGRFMLLTFYNLLSFVAKFLTLMNSIYYKSHS